VIVIPGAPNSLPGRSEEPYRPQFRLLGPVEVWREGSLIDVGGPLQRTLVACLLLRAGEVVSRERLIDVLWGNDPPPRAGRSLETKVSRLRRTLGANAPVVGRGGGYVLNVLPDQVDAYRFEAAVSEGRRLLLAQDPQGARRYLTQALRLWHGQALGGVAEGALAVDRDRLEEERLQTLEARIDADLALGAGTSLVSELEALRCEHPLRERFAEQLMVALYRSGRQAEALATYRRAHRVLADQLGLEPGPRLRELEQAVMHHDESLGPLPITPRLTRAARSPRAIVAAAALCLAVVLTTSFGSPQRSRAPLSPGLILLDAASGATRADLAIGDSQGFTGFARGLLWTIGDNGVMSEINPQSSTLVRSIPVGVDAGGLAVGAGAVWVTDRNSTTLVRIDPLTGLVNLRARLSSVGLMRAEPAGGVVIDDGSLWIARGSEAIDRLDPSSLRLQRRIRLRQGDCGLAQCALAAGRDRVWVAGGDNGMLTGISEASNKVVATTRLQPYLCCVAAGGGAVWVAEAHDVAKISPLGQVLRRFNVGNASIGNLSYNGGYLWATADTTGELLRIGGDNHVRTTHLGNLLIGTAAGQGIVAVAALPLDTGATHGLGRKVLRVGLTQDWLNPTDPALTGPPSGTGRWQWQLQHATCAGLYEYPETTGARSAAPQPELASGPPRRSADGRTWTIPLHTGLRFSPPLNRPVTPEDIRASIIRALSPELGQSAPASRLLREVVGVRAYNHGTSPDVPGITLHNGALVIRTLLPVDDLSARLALPYFCVLPAGIPSPPGGYIDPLPTAGPYYLASHQGAGVAVLRRNPGYLGPRPQHLDAIIFEMNIGDPIGIADVSSGRLDYYFGKRVTVAKRVGCRITGQRAPGLDLAALCLVPTSTQTRPTPP
jgi:DNA-binding SARP family transcriptional activator/streptogramin lyase